MRRKVASGWAVRCGPGEGRKDQGAKLEERLSQSRQRPAVPGRKALTRWGDETGEQAKAETVEPWRAAAGGREAERGETLDRKRGTTI